MGKDSRNASKLHFYSVSLTPISVFSFFLRFAIAVFFSTHAFHASAAEFKTVNDVSISGEIVRFDYNLIAIQTSVGSLINLPRSEIKLVRFNLNDGRIIEGSISKWIDGIYTIKYEDGLIEIKDDTVISETALSDDSDDRETANTDADDNIALKVITESGLVDVIVDVEITSESSPTVIFNINLSRKIDEDIILIYSTIESTAKSDLDFEADNGSIIIPGGTSTTNLPIRLINDDKSEEEEVFMLFLGACSNLSTGNKPVFASIGDDDE